mgnify:CR=1 FL=1
MTGVMETDIIFIPEQKNRRSAAFSVYMSVKNTLLSEFFSEALVILVKKLVNLFHDLLHNIHP